MRLRVAAEHFQRVVGGFTTQRVEHSARTQAARHYLIVHQVSFENAPICAREFSLRDRDDVSCRWHNVARRFPALLRFPWLKLYLGLAFVVFPLSIVVCTTGEAHSSLSMSLTLDKLSHVMTAEEKRQTVSLTCVPEVSSSAVLRKKREPEIQNQTFKKDRNLSAWAECGRAARSNMHGFCVKPELHSATCPHTAVGGSSTSWCLLHVSGCSSIHQSKCSQRGSC